MEYDKKILRKLQLVELEMLSDIDEFCKRNNLEYVVAYGTVLGAVRHGGFIPWDDDIDIALLREDYDRFIQLAQEQLSDKYNILTMENTKRYINCFAKVSKKGTKIVQQDSRYDLGIYIDVFPYDYVEEDEKIRKKKIIKGRIYKIILVLSEISNPVVLNTLKGIRKIIVMLGCKIVHIILKLLHINRLKLYKKYLKLVVSDKKKLIVDYGASDMEKTLIQKNEVFPAKNMVFEGREFPVPNNVDKYLKNIYGNYMELPPKEKRRNHFPKELLFGDEE